MAGFSQEDIQHVREANDIVDVFSERMPLKQRGRDFWCCCPFHQEKTPSCKIDPNTQLWHCFGCGEGGDLFSFVMKMDGLDFPDAVRWLADRAHIEIEERGGRGLPRGQKARLQEICKEAAEFYHLQLMRSRDAGAASAREYLGSRGLGGEIPRKWKLGYAPGHGQLVSYLRSKGFHDNEMIQANVATAPRGRGGVRDRFYERVMFPIHDVRGGCIAFGGRVIGTGEPKYLNSQETPIFHKSEVLYGLDQAKTAITATGTAIVVEGYTDVIALHTAGVENAVATLGTALTRQHIREISRFASKRIVYLFDGDAAGQRAADRALQFIDYSMTPESGKMRVELLAVVLPDNLDPADFVAQRGAGQLREQVAQARPLLQFGIDRRLAAHSLDTPEGRSAAFVDALSVLAPIKDSLIANEYAVQIAGRVRVSETEALSRLAQLKPPRELSEGSQAATRNGAAGNGAFGNGAAAGAQGGATPQGGASGRGGAPMQGAPMQRGGSSAQQAGRGGSYSYGATAGGNGGGSFGNSPVAGGSASGGNPDGYAGNAGGYGAGAYGAGGSQGAASAGESVRLRFERSFLSVCAQNPILALAHADTIARTSWHDDAYAQVAALLLQMLAEEPGIAPATLVARIGESVPAASGFLTSAETREGEEEGRYAQFLAEELVIGDMEDQIESMQSLIRDPSISQDDYRIYFNQIQAMQRELYLKRLAHKPL